MAQLSLFLVVLFALVVPILMARLRVNAVPTAVAEIIIGIVLGASGFNLVRPTHDLSFLSNLGVILLLFLSGMEINFDLLKPGQKSKRKKGQIAPLKVALNAFLGVTILSICLALLLKMLGLFGDVMLATIIFMTVALGVVIATLKEKDILNRPIGQTILLTAVLGEVIPLMLLTVYAAINGGNTKQLWLIILLFGVAILLLWRFKQPYLWFVKVTKSTTQLDVRLAFFLIFALVTVAERVGVENILGAFLAGIVMKLLEPSQETADKLTSIGYGFFIPIFFIMTGAKLNLRSLLAHPKSLILLPILVLFLFLAKVPVALVYAQKFGSRNGIAGGFLTATTITIVLPTLAVARKLNVITRLQSDVFILAAVIVCILCPILFNAIFKLKAEDRIKEKVVILGTNALTVPVMLDLHDNWYSVKMFTTSNEHYHIYQSRVPQLKLLFPLDSESLAQSGAFTGDIFVAAMRSDDTNLRLGQLAQEQGDFKRIIICQKRADIARVKELRKSGMEVFDLSNITSALLRALIESPALYSVLSDTKNAVYSVVVRNTQYSGRQLMDWDVAHDITVSRIRRGQEWLVPHGHTVIELGDELIFTAKYQAADRMRKVIGKK
ncbi:MULTISPECIES: cation:proton antiporter domain-containing protein [unclassified Lactobacillus]|uniref:cation:proton antiporter domain-containing protein n=1 Tax=unclassified Lactobacillus TaxID=2620435 RepID=UPI0018DEA37B|nr:monovalent cation:proton antiporter family protein [Lactobacillus sp. M0392]MBI0024019.1 monovalent cation:proton antiporter family protein [Lactobacillus sp. W8171]MBI0044449.1 monovalent cation:proton antiporter family protein [Lactobacillus sp. M0393]